MPLDSLYSKPLDIPPTYLCDMTGLTLEGLQSGQHATPRWINPWFNFRKHRIKDIGPVRVPNFQARIKLHNHLISFGVLRPQPDLLLVVHVTFGKAPRACCIPLKGFEPIEPTQPEDCLMTVAEFNQVCDSGGFIDYDGFGYAVGPTGLMDTYYSVVPSKRKHIPFWATHVLWFNR